MRIFAINLFLITTCNALSLYQVSRRNMVQYMSPYIVTGKRYIEFDRESNIIKSIGNNIYFYAPVTQENCFSLIQKLFELETKNIYQYQNSSSINLHIQSNGGSIINALYVIDVISKIRVPVHTYVDGFVANAASLITCVGDHRYMTDIRLWFYKIQL